MAYITAEKTADIRRNLKAAFPGWTFSVRCRHYSSLDVAVMAAPFDLIPGAAKRRCTVNPYYIDRDFTGPAAEALKRIKAICNEGNHDNSDPMTDYFDVGWYLSLAIGRWEKPFQVRPPKTKEAA